MTETIKSGVIGESCLKYVHKSGVTVYMLPMKGYSTAVAQLAVRFGSEDNACRVNGGELLTVPDGTAHYLEHKLFESEEVDAFRLFAETGAACNAATSFDYTMYYFSCTDRFDENLRILLDFVQKPYFTPENVEKERGIITQEITMYRDNPGWRILTGLLEGVYAKHPIRNDIAGSAESISRITDKLLYDVYNAYYNPSNMFLCAAGNFDPEQVIAICDETLCDRQSLSVTAEPFDEPQAVNSPRTEIKMPVSKPQFAIGFKRPITAEAHALREYIDSNILFDSIFGEMSDFYERMRNAGHINDTFSSGTLKGRKFLVPMIRGEAADPDFIRDEVVKELKRAKSAPPSKRIFDRLKKTAYGSLVRMYNSAHSVAQSLCDAALAGLSPFSAIEAAAAADYDGMLRYLSELDEDNNTIMIISPTHWEGVFKS